MRTAKVERIEHGWQVLCRFDDEVLHALYVYDIDCNDLFQDSFSVALSRAEFWLAAGLVIPFSGFSS